MNLERVWSGEEKDSEKNRNFHFVDPKKKQVVEKQTIIIILDFLSLVLKDLVKIKCHKRDSHSSKFKLLLHLDV